MILLPKIIDQAYVSIDTITESICNYTTKSDDIIATIHSRLQVTREIDSKVYRVTKIGILSDLI